MLRKTDTAHFWDGVARKYARDRIKDMAGYERTIERTQEFLRRSDTVLEIGCGTGTTALKLAPLVSSIVANDVSSEMIAIAREKAGSESCRNVTFEAGKAEQPEGGIEAYDAVLAFNLLHLITGRPSMLARIRDLVKPGGLFISKTPCLSEMNPMIRVAVPAMRLIGKAPVVSFFSASEIEAEIASAGFQIEVTERHGSGRKDPRIFIVARRP